MWNKGLYLVLLVVGSAVGEEKVNFCVQDKCNNIKLENGEVTCVLIKDRVECIEKLLNGEADVGFLNSEELLLLHEMSTVNQKKFNVVAKSIDTAPTRNILLDNLFETVAIVKNEHKNGLEGLKNYIYYRSDFGASVFTPRVLEAFERKVVKISNCAPGLTEDEILTEELQKFFKSACRSGSWTPDSKQDEYLKNNITKLCSACDDATKCKYKETQALDKLIASTENAVAYATWKETASYFNDNKDKINKYALLCPDGNIKKLESTMLDKTSVNDCAFITQPRAAVVAVSTKSDDIKTKIESWWQGGIPAEGVEKEWKNAIYPKIDTNNMKITFEKKSLKDYVPAVEPITTTCIAEHTWYVAPGEKKKCDLIAGAARVIGVTPKVKCENSTEETIKKLNSTRGFMKFSSKDGYIARKVYNLAAAKTLNITDHIVAVIAKQAYDKKNNVTLADFSSSHACFPKFGDLSHVAFISKLRSLNLTKENECDFGKIVADHFGSVCLPGADTASTLFPYTSSATTKLCNCKKSDGKATCAAESSNKYYENVLNCLADNDTSIAFLNHNDIPQGDFEKYYVLCFGDDKKATKLTNLVEENCTIAYNMTNQEILTSSASIKIVKTFFDYLGKYLSGTEENTHFIQFQWFARIFEPPASVFYGSEEKAIANYENMLKDLSSCVPPSPPETANVTKGSTRSVCSVVTLFLLSLLSRFL